MTTERGRYNPTRHRNRKCICGSGLKFKDCCLHKGGYALSPSESVSEFDKSNSTVNVFEFKPSQQRRRDAELIATIKEPKEVKP